MLIDVCFCEQFFAITLTLLLQSIRFARFVLAVVTRQMQENFRVKGKKLYFGFVDLEKAFDRVPREVISWAMRKVGVEEWLNACQN